mmetsp:Transcript_104483/g.302326  ORF Transcript_104483/g.302326 Transcript_104483/m.302326 type:complete len:267 (-) Transcript_104483:150-950(-)
MNFLWDSSGLMLYNLTVFAPRTAMAFRASFQVPSSSSAVGSAAYASFGAGGSPGVQLPSFIKRKSKTWFRGLYATPLAKKRSPVFELYIMLPLMTTGCVPPTFLAFGNGACGFKGSCRSLFGFASALWPSSRSPLSSPLSSSSSSSLSSSLSCSSSSCFCSSCLLLSCFSSSSPGASAASSPLSCSSSATGRPSSPSSALMSVLSWSRSASLSSSSSSSHSSKDGGGPGGNRSACRAASIAFRVARNCMALTAQPSASAPAKHSSS